MAHFSEEQLFQLFISGYIIGRRSAGFYLLDDNEKQVAFKNELTDIVGTYPDFDSEPLPELIQCTEMLYDHFKHKGENMIAQAAKQTLIKANAFKEEEE